MSKEIVLSLVIDRCHGVWLDEGELEQMKSTIETGLSKELLTGISFLPY
jgi:Zn-finger nucleic acid-binding protein